LAVAEGVTCNGGFLFEIDASFSGAERGSRCRSERISQSAFRASGNMASSGAWPLAAGGRFWPRAAGRADTSCPCRTRASSHRTS